MEKELLIEEIMKRVQQYISEDIQADEKEHDCCWIDFLDDSAILGSSEYKVIRLKNLPIDVMVALATGQCICKKTQLVRDAFLVGKKVIIDKAQIELFKYKDSAAKTYYNMLKSHLELLEKSGLSIGAVKEEAEKAVESVPQTFYKQEGEVVTKRLLTEQDLIGYNIAGVSTLCVNKKTIITDLAKDYAKQYRITIVRSCS